MSNVTSLAAVARRHELIQGGLAPIQAAPWVQDFEARTVLDHLCKERYLLAKASLVWIERPYLQEAALKFIEYVTLHFPGPKGSLVGNAIEEAVQAYFTGMYSPKATASQIAFIRTFVMQADHIIGHQVVAVSERPGKIHVWQSWAEALPKWLKRGDFGEFFMRRREVVADREKASARKALAALLFPPEALELADLDCCSRCGAFL